MNVLKELISQVKRKEIKDYDDLMAVLQYVNQLEEFDAKNVFAHKTCFHYDDVDNVCFSNRKPCKGKCIAYEADCAKLDRYF